MSVCLSVSVSVSVSVSPHPHAPSHLLDEGQELAVECDDHTLLALQQSNRGVSNRCFSDARPEGCATDPSRWRHWNDKVKRWAADADKHHVIAANNQYDARYIRHFSGVPAEAIPSYCDKGFSYAPSRGPVLLSMTQRLSLIHI